MEKTRTKKYRDITATARDLFFRYGTRRVTVEEICEKSGVSKMTFYRFFRNKNDCALQVLDEWFKGADARYSAIMEREIPFVDRVRELILLKVEMSRELGDEFLSEIIEPNQVLHDFIMEQALKYHDMTVEFFIKGQQEGIINPCYSIEFLVVLTDRIRDMLNNEDIKRVIPDPHDRIEAVLKCFFYGIAGMEPGQDTLQYE